MRAGKAVVTGTCRALWSQRLLRHTDWETGNNSPVSPRERKPLIPEEADQTQTERERAGPACPPGAEAVGRAPRSPRVCLWGCPSCPAA